MKPSELLRWRKKNKYSQIKLGKALGVSTITVYRWEKAMREIPSFLHLALKWLELKGGESMKKGKRNNQIEPILLKPTQVAKLLSVSRNKVYELVLDGELIAHCHRGIKVKPMFITTDSVERFKENEKRKGVKK